MNSSKFNTHSLYYEYDSQLKSLSSEQILKAHFDFIQKRKQYLFSGKSLENCDSEIKSLKNFTFLYSKNPQNTDTPNLNRAFLENYILQHPNTGLEEHPDISKFNIHQVNDGFIPSWTISQDNVLTTQRPAVFQPDTPLLDNFSFSNFYFFFNKYVLDYTSLPFSYRFQFISDEHSQIRFLEFSRTDRTPLFSTDSLIFNYNFLKFRLINSFEYFTRYFSEIYLDPNLSTNWNLLPEYILICFLGFIFLFWSVLLNESNFFALYLEFIYKISFIILFLCAFVCFKTFGVLLSDLNDINLYETHQFCFWLFGFEIYEVTEVTQFYKLSLIILQIILLYASKNYFSKPGVCPKLHVLDFIVFSFGALFSMFLLLSSTSFLFAFFSLEFQSICLCLMAAIKKIEGKQMGGIPFYLLIVSILVGGLFAFGSFLIYFATGSTFFVSSSSSLEILTNLNFFNMQNINYDSAFSPFFNINSVIDPILNTSYGAQISLIGLIFIFVSLTIKLGQVPFYAPMPDIYAGVAAPVSIFLAVISKFSIVLFFCLILQYYQNFISNFLEIHFFFILIAILSSIIGPLGAFSQTSFRKFLGFSSISHLAFIYLAFSSFDSISLQSSIVFFFCYTIVSFLIWSFCLIQKNKFNFIFSRFKLYNKNSQKFYFFVKKNKTFTNVIFYISDFLNLLNTNKVLVFITLITVFSYSATPPSILFLFKFNLLLELLAQGFIFFTLIILLLSILPLYYYLSLIKFFLFNLTFKNFKISLNLQSNISWILSFLSLILIFLSIFPDFLKNISFNLNDNIFYNLSENEFFFAPKYSQELGATLNNSLIDKLSSENERIESIKASVDLNRLSIIKENILYGNIHSKDLNLTTLYFKHMVATYYNAFDANPELALLDKVPAEFKHLGTNLPNLVPISEEAFNLARFRYLNLVRQIPFLIEDMTVPKDGVNRYFAPNFLYRADYPREYGVATYADNLVLEIARGKVQRYNYGLKAGFMKPITKPKEFVEFFFEGNIRVFNDFIDSYKKYLIIETKKYLKENNYNMNLILTDPYIKGIWEEIPKTSNHIKDVNNFCEKKGQYDVSMIKIPEDTPYGNPFEIVKNKNLDIINSKILKINK